MDRVEYGTGFSRIFSYDAANRIKTISNTAGGESESYGYDYDPNGNRILETRNRSGQAQLTITYDHDLLDRLKRVDFGPATVNYTYDAVGNRKTETGTRPNGQAVDYTYNHDAANQLRSITDGTGSIVASYGYDLNGNVTSWTQGNTSWTYDYDVREQLVKATRTVVPQIGPTETASGFYEYDYDKRRIGRKWADEGWIRSVHAEDQIANEFTDAGALVNRYEYGLEVLRGETDGYYFGDAQGSVTLVAGTQTVKTDYDPWGVVLSGQRQGSSIGYTGQWGDEQTGLMPLGNGERYYLPGLGRFVQEDGFEGLLNVAQSLNRYIYAYNNPFVYFDPTGRNAEPVGDIRTAAESYGLNEKGENTKWNIIKNTAARTGYDLWNLISFGALERQERIVIEYDKGKMSNLELWGRSSLNLAVSAAQLGLTVATGGIGVSVARAGIGLGGKMLIGAGLSIGEKFVGESLEMATGFRERYSSAQEYALTGLFGAGGELIGAGINRVAMITEGTRTVGAGLRALKEEGKLVARDFAQGYKSVGRGTYLGSGGGGLQNLSDRVEAGVRNAATQQETRLAAREATATADDVAEAVVAEEGRTSTTRERLLENISESRTARSTSNFEGHVQQTGSTPQRRGLTYVEERVGTSQRAIDYQSTVPGASSNIQTRRSVVPALLYDNPNRRGRGFIKFDGIEGRTLIDRKLNITSKSKQLNDLRRMSLALRQNPMYQLRIEVPTDSIRRTAERILRELRITNIQVRTVAAP